MALVLAGFTHLWNPIGFPVPNEDESIYLGRAVNFLNTLDVRDNSIGYDHPYFGQIFLAAFLGITGYQDFFSSPGHLNYEMIFLIPRIFMGILAIADTFLIFKIAELLYNRKVGFVAAILFAVTPTTWLTRWILLDSLQLPLILLSILFAVFSFRGTREGSKNNSKNILLVLLSGTFLGLSIFTKIPAIMIVPLVGYLIFTNSKWNFKILGLWFIPVILIPLLWPAYSISVGEFNSWLNGIIKQAHRAPNPLYFSITEFLMRDPLLLIVGTIGIILAVVKKDLFILLAVIPFLIFMYLVNYVVLHHLMWVVVILCISASRLFVDIVTFVKRYKPLLLLSLGGISLFFVFAFTSTIELVTRNETSQFFGAAALVDQYLEAELISNNNNNPDSNKNIKVLGNTFFIWIQQYVFHNDNYVSFFQIPKKLEFENQNVIFIIDSRFKRELQRDDYTGITLRKMFSTFDTKSIATFNPTLYGDKIDILLTNLERPNLPISGVTASGNDGNVPANVLDNNLGTRWSSDGNGQFITADLGTVKNICSVDIAWYSGNSRQYHFVISTSTDGNSFTQRFSGDSSGTTLISEKYTFPAVEARFVRVTVNGNTVNTWASITELHVFGSSASALASSQYNFGPC